ncbi:hypothetical protein COV16_00840 [Candidatus Woesearchaeota archaeon CG10_big_fil_rev_8_21_14_0_10_34_8]|nr:MAG: hypothetical protein COV16_00840 [Candidatus Woesearchaeota archaeon CG10_big_fil_rev_8_21_14_0_10_34_8]
MTKKKPNGKSFQWSKLVYTLIVIFLYVPLVFIGVRTFLPEYSGYNDYPYKDCYMYQPVPEDVTVAEREELNGKYNECYEEQRAEQQAYEEEKRQYDIWKYMVVLAVALVTLLAVLFVPLDTAIKIGFFVGSAATVFISTIQYFETESKIAFAVLVVVFCMVVYAIHKREKFFS